MEDLAPERNGAVDRHVHAIDLPLHLLDHARFQLGILPVDRRLRVNDVLRTRGGPVDQPSVGGGVELPLELVVVVDVSLHQKPVLGVVRELEIHPGNEDGGVQSWPRGSGSCFVVANPVRVLIALVDLIAAEERGAEERGAHLAHTAAGALHCAAIVDDQCFTVSGVQADLTQKLSH